MAIPIRELQPDLKENLTAQYGCGPVKFSGTDEALYERHLLFDSVTNVKLADARDRFEAIARSVRAESVRPWSAERIDCNAITTRRSTGRR